MQTHPVLVKGQVKGQARFIDTVLQFPLSRIVLGILFVAIGVLAAQLVVALLQQALSLKSPFPAPFVGLEVVLAVLAPFLAYGAYAHLVERRSATELSRTGALGDLSLGIVGGVGLIAAVIGILWLLGDYHVTGTNHWTVLLVPLAADVPSAAIQQVVFQGIIFRIIEEYLGTWWALLISVALFGFVHLLLITQMTATGLLSIVVGGALFTAAYVWTRRLWLSSSLHATLDFTVDAIFGVGAYHLSGVAAVGLLSAQLSGPSVLTGGAFGVEASAVTLGLLLATALLLLVWAERHGRRVPPAGSRDRLRRQGTGS
jgi:membrane protease YdiL (CAAX protease family)